MFMSRRLHKLWGLAFCLLAGPFVAFSAEWTVGKPGQSLFESFDSFLGTYVTLPAGFSVSADGQKPMTVDDPDFKGVHSGGTIAGGCYAWRMATNDHALGCQPTADKFTPGYFEVVVSNATGKVIPGMTLSFDVVCLDNAERSSRLDFMYSTDGERWIVVEAAAYVSPEESDRIPVWVSTPRQVRICFPADLPPNGRLRLRWVCDDSGGVGSRDEYGIDNLAVTFHPPPPPGTVMSIL